jgi:hypothetical protein
MPPSPTHAGAATLQDACNLARQVDRRPWTMVAGAAALGFLGGRLLRRHGASPVCAGITVADRLAGAGVNGAPHGVNEPSWLAALAVALQPELAELKGLALGAVLSLARDVITESMAGPAERKVASVLDRMTVKLGGRPQGVSALGSAHRGGLRL